MRGHSRPDLTTCALRFRTLTRYTNYTVVYEPGTVPFRVLSRSSREKKDFAASLDSDGEYHDRIARRAFRPDRSATLGPLQTYPGNRPRRRWLFAVNSWRMFTCFRRRPSAR